MGRSTRNVGSGDPTGFTHQAEPRRTKEKVTGFYVRGLNGTKALDVVEKQKYIAQRWPGAPEGL